MKKHLDAWWDWRAAATTTGDEDSSISPEAALELLVQKCVVLDNLSPVSYVHTIRTALEQFGKVRGVKLVRDCQTCLFTGVAFAEMESKEQRDQVVKELKDYLLMIGQMPRPARAIPACPELMVDHPLRSFSRKVSARLVTPKNPRWAQLHETAIQENIHYAHQSALIQLRREEELKLEKSQQRICQENIDKLKLLEGQKSSDAYQVVKRLHGGLRR